MYQRILIPTDGSVLAEKAVEQGLELAKQLAAEVMSVFVWVPIQNNCPDIISGYTTPLPVDDVECQTQIAAAVNTRFSQYASAAGLPNSSVVLIHDDPAQGIIQTAQEQNCDLIFMASHGHRGVKAMLLGSVTKAVLSRCQIPVLVFR